MGIHNKCFRGDCWKNIKIETSPISAQSDQPSLITRAVYSLRLIQRGMNENHCNTGLMYRLIQVFAGYTGLIVGFVVRWINIGIKHGFSCINIRQVPWEVLKTEAEGRGFQHLPRDLANVNALKNHVRSLFLHKKLKIFAIFRVISCTFLFRLFTDVSRT